MIKTVDINNDMLTFPFETLSDGGLELFFSICYACRNEKTTEIQTNIKEIRKARGYEDLDDFELKKKLLAMGRTLLSFNVILNDEDSTVIAPFTVFHFNGETLRIRLNDEFLHHFSGFVSNYTLVDAIQIMRIWGKHGKALYKILRRYRGMEDPIAKLKESDLIEKMGIENTSKEEIDSIIVHSTREVSRCLPNLGARRDTVDSETYITFGFDKLSLELNTEAAKNSKWTSMKPVVKFKSVEPRLNLLGVKEVYPNLENYI
jgi:hypothetical protein